MLNQPLLLAEAFGTIISAVVIVFWIISQVMGARQDAKGKQKPEAQPRRQQAQPVPGQPRNQGDALRSEVEQFLRRAQGKPEPETMRPETQQRQMPTPDRQPQRSQQKRRPQATPPAVRTIVNKEEPSLRNEGVAEHVSRHLSTQGIVDHAQNLGDEVALADDKLESRLHATFDHNVGHMKHRDAYSTDKAPQVDIAAEVAAMLSSPKGMRQLIIANEILRRPEW